MFQLGVTSKLQQVDLIAELKKKQVSPQVREGKDGTIEDIITGTHPRRQIASVRFTPMLQDEEIGPPSVQSCQGAASLA